MPRKRAISKKKRKMKQLNKAQENGHFIFKNYIVCLIDLLGQSEQLKSWPPLPSSEHEILPFQHAVNKSLGVIESLTNDFKRFFDVFLDHSVPNRIPTPNGVDTADLIEYRQLAVKIRENKIGVQQFSDTLVFYVPLFPGSLQIPSLMPIITMTQVCSMLIIEYLSSGVVFRGGITIGVGTFTQKYGFYGPALQKAHHLESKVARYPRIVFEKDLLATLHKQARNTLGPDLRRVFFAESVMLHGWIFTDKEGIESIDFMGKGMVELARRGPVDKKMEFKEKIRNAYNFVCSEETRFSQEKMSESDEKIKKAKETLFERYKTLREYMDSRLDSWDQI